MFVWFVFVSYSVYLFLFGFVPFPVGAHSLSFSFPVRLCFYPVSVPIGFEFDSSRSDSACLPAPFLSGSESLYFVSDPFQFRFLFVPFRFRFMPILFRLSALRVQLLFRFPSYSVQFPVPFRFGLVFGLFCFLFFFFCFDPFRFSSFSVLYYFVSFLGFHFGSFLFDTHCSDTVPCPFWLPFCFVYVFFLLRFDFLRIFSFLLTTWCRVLLEKLAGLQLV